VDSSGPELAGTTWYFQYCHLVRTGEGVESVARKVVVELVDDIDGTVFGADGESIHYAVDGVEYVIDLKDEHAKELRETFEYYIAHSTRVGGRKHRADRPANPTTAKRQRGEATKIRAWAIEQGYELSSRGPHPGRDRGGLPRRAVTTGLGLRRLWISPDHLGVGIPLDGPLLNQLTVALIPRVPHQKSRCERPLAERRYGVTVTPEPGKTYIA
jgi:hypothetical protein